MSIDFHEPGPRFESDESLELRIIPPSGEKSWAIAFDAKTPEEAKIYDKAIDAVLHIEMMMPHLIVSESTETHREWEIREKSLSEEKEGEVRDYLEKMIIKIKKLVQGNLTTRLAA